MKPVLNDVLCVRNYHPRDKHIKFYEEEHKYIIDLEPDVKYTSVTTWIHEHFEKFPIKATEKNVDRVNLNDVNTTIFEREVHLSDLDVVNHVNNVKYLEWCLNLINPKDVLNQNITSFEIAHNILSKLGALITLIVLLYITFKILPELLDELYCCLDLPKRKGPLERFIKNNIWKRK